MDTNENEEVKGTEAEETEEETEGQDTDTKKEAPKTEKPKRTPEEELEYFEGRASRLRKKLGKDQEEPAPKSKPSSDKFEYGELAFLKAYGVEGSDELQLVRQYKSHGKSLDEIVKHKVFLADLADLREARSVQEALPSGTKRSTTTSKDKVDYWIEKGELPPNTPDNQQLRREVVNAREKRAREGSKFSDTPVIG